MQAGFTQQQAEALATGTQRVDSGDMQFIEVVMTYACIGKDEERRPRGASLSVRGPVPVRLSNSVIAGSDAARQMAIGVTKGHRRLRIHAVQLR